MAEKKRQCGTCRFFVEKEASGHGKCTHPKRAGMDAELLLLRPSELACRTRWGDSLWQDPADDSNPMEEKSPQQPTLPEPIAAQLQFDDEVTSVSIAGSKSSRSTFDDDVVDSGATTTGMASWNDPVQDERLDLLRKSSHDALAGARKRHMEKQARQRELIPFAEGEDEEAPEPKQSLKPAPDEAPVPVEPVVRRNPLFPADDFVEEERGSADNAPTDDEMVDEGLAHERNRSPRLRKLMREPNNPKRNEAMRSAMPQEMRVTSHNPEHREEWNTVPTLNPGIEIPLSTKADNQPKPHVRLAASAAPIASASYQSRPVVSQAREVKAEERQRQERAQRQTVAPLIDHEPLDRQEDELHAELERPRLTQAPPPDAAQIERIKSSPLRGYHPATRKLVKHNQDDQSRQHPVQRPPDNYRASQHQESPASQSKQAPRTTRQVDPSVDPQMPRLASEPGRVEQPQRPARQAESAPVRSGPNVAPKQSRPYIPLHQDRTPFEQEQIEISPDVERCCGTCTSYRPSKVAGRGSCTNAFAGPVQRVVYEQDLSCQHSYGSFWLPADEEVWLEELNTDYPPTPRVDAMLARRRRRESTVLPDLDELTS